MRTVYTSPVYWTFDLESTLKPIDTGNNPKRLATHVFCNFITHGGTELHVRSPELAAFFFFTVRS